MIAEFLAKYGKFVYIVMKFQREDVVFLEFLLWSLQMAKACLTNK